MPDILKKVLVFQLNQESYTYLEQDIITTQLLNDCNDEINKLLNKPKRMCFNKSCCYNECNDKIKSLHKPNSCCFTK